MSLSAGAALYKIPAFLPEIKEGQGSVVRHAIFVNAAEETIADSTVTGFFLLKRFQNMFKWAPLHCGIFSDGGQHGSLFIPRSKSLAV